MILKDENLMTLRQVAAFHDMPTNNLLYYIDELKLLKPVITIDGRRYFNKKEAKAWRKPRDKRTLTKDERV